MCSTGTTSSSSSWPGDEAGFAGALAVTTRTRRYGVARSAHGGPRPSWRGLVVGARRPRAVDRQRARPRGHRGTGGIEPDGSRRPPGGRPVRRRRARAAATVPRAGSPAPSCTAGGSRCNPRAPIWFREPGEPAGPRAWIDATGTRSKSGRRRIGHRPRIVFVVGFSSSSLGHSRCCCCLRYCRSSASTLSRDSTAGRSYCMICFLPPAVDHSASPHGIILASTSVDFHNYAATKRCRFVQTPS